MQTLSLVIVLKGLAFALLNGRFTRAAEKLLALFRGAKDRRLVLRFCLLGQVKVLVFLHLLSTLLDKLDQG